ncbi:hypothetical protein DFH09DRAFT_1248846 [Mycena vulgaris]|nr:hypothetical protein DFH09DRAFT_1248846 [Mycena vulgaris]
MRECNTPNMPSFSALRKKQKSLTRDVGIKSEHHTSSLGNHFYMNHPAKLLALDWANPLVRPFIHVYPEVSGPVAEFWQAEKWVSEIDLDDLSPMWADWQNKSNSHRHFYIKELAQLSDGTYVLPPRWVTVNNVVHVDIYDVGFFGDLSHHCASVTNGLVLFHNLRQIPASRLKSNYLDLCTSSSAIKFTEYSPAYSMPHPLQYSAHTNVYVVNLNIPHQKLQQEYYIRFASTSPNASSSEQFVTLGEDCVPGIWHEAYDCEFEEEIPFEIIPHVLPADNPQQSETSSHVGMAGSLGCRRDLTGGTKEYWSSENNLSLQPGVPCQNDVTIQVIRWQVWMACLDNKSGLEASYTSTGVKDKISQHWISELLEKAKRAALKSQIKYRIQQELWDWVVQQPNEFIPLPENDPLRLGLDLKAGKHYNVLLDMRGIDPHHDTPGEILHTYLLGNDKYVWHDTTKNWDDEKANIFASRLQSSSIDSLSIPPPRPRYVFQYKNSLIGKDFKMLQQLGVFQLHGFCSPLLFDLWKATGELGAHLWFPEIKNMDVYIADLEVLIGNLLDIWAVIDPNRILVKGKLHVIAHLVDDVRRFGPSVLYATEIFECWNAIFLLCSILSNHLSPSHDIAVTLADMERFEHMVSGGWWKNPDGRYIRAGSSVRSFLTSNGVLQRRLRRTLKPQSAAKRQPTTWNSMLPEPQPIGATWVQCKSVVAQSGDCCKPGFWVFVRKGENSEPFAGRIAEILARGGSTLTQQNTVVMVEPFTVLDIKDPRLNMPILVPSQDIASVKVKPQEIMLSFNAQNDYTVPVRQERIITDRTELQVIHSAEQQFILNMHGLHNAHLIREVLPRALIAPVPYLQDRCASHLRFATQLRQTEPARRAEIQAKTKATRAKNKQGKDILASAQARRQQDEQVDAAQGLNSDMEVDED